METITFGLVEPLIAWGNKRQFIKTIAIERSYCNKCGNQSVDGLALALLWEGLSPNLTRGTCREIPLCLTVQKGFVGKTFHCRGYQ